MSEDEAVGHAKLTAADRDKASPVWDMSQERAFIENLLAQRFNFFLVFFSIVVAGSVNAKTQTQLRILLGIGSIVSVLFALVLERSQEKLDLVLRDIFSDASHPATIIDTRARKSGSRRKLIGVWIPRLCCALLVLGFGLAIFGVLRVSQQTTLQSGTVSQQTAPPSGNAVAGPLQAGSASEQVPKWLQVIKAAAEVLAYLFAFVFFLYKSYEGYLTTNLSLSLECRRCPASRVEKQPDKDYLVVTAKIKKGENGLMKLMLAEVRILALNSRLEQKQGLDIRRVGYDRPGVLSGRENSIQWDTARIGWPFLQFPPGDGSHFACQFLVPTGEPCQVDVVVMGRGRWPKVKTSQWRASDISLPKYLQGTANGETQGKGEARD